MIRIFADTFKNLITSWAVILKTESENERLSSLSGESAGLRIGREHNGAESTSTDPIVTAANMDPALPAMIKQADYVVDVILPTVLIALLFVGNAIIVYIIFQYRKRKSPMTISQGEEMVLNSNAACNAPQV